MTKIAVAAIGEAWLLGRVGGGAATHFPARVGAKRLSRRHLEPETQRLNSMSEWPGAKAQDTGAAWPSNDSAEVVAVEAVAITDEARDLRVTTWLDAKAALAVAKGAEASFRQLVTDTCFPTPVKGTQRYALGNGYNLKLVHGWTYTLGEAKVTDPETQVTKTRAQVVEFIQDQLDELGEAGEMLAMRLFKWEPSLVEAEYMALDPINPTQAKAKTLIDEILIVKAASPQLDFEEPKAPK